jgi:hypothetical protein
MVGLLGVFMVEKLVPLLTFAQGIVMKGKIKKVAQLITCSLAMTKEKVLQSSPINGTSRIGKLNSTLK